MHAGPYKKWEDTSGKYPMRLFARQSVAAQVKPAEWFKYTKSGLAFFDDYFGIPYQFEKYDQILVPDFLYGAMENAGAITFAERGFMYKADMTSEQRQRLASVIMHEMAHQWFGDLVTMKWWNGLWLNESFASFMGTLATAEATEFKDAWRAFYSTGKQGAYAQDQRSTTHPIEVPVPSTQNAFDNIDAITYSKGASTLMQLRHLLGADVFRKGVHNYLVKYQYRNATLDDFIGSLGEAAGRDLKGWTKEWLYQPGVNTIAANYSCANGKIKSFSLEQSATKQLPTLREQRVQVASFRMDGKQLKLDKNVAIIYKGAKTAVPAWWARLPGPGVPELRGLGLREGPAGQALLRHRARQPGRRRRSAAARHAVAEPVGRRARRQAAAERLHHHRAEQRAAGKGLHPAGRRAGQGRRREALPER
jgi:aminopeptidase N